METALITIFFEQIRAIFSSLMEQIREINRKYATPEIQMTGFVKLCLLGLRIYLLLLVLLMIVKFIITARS